MVPQAMVNLNRLRELTMMPVSATPQHKPYRSPQSLCMLLQSRVGGQLLLDPSAGGRRRQGGSVLPQTHKPCFSH